MIKLVNGRGQLGNELSNLLKENPLWQKERDCTIYHTWNRKDKNDMLEQSKQSCNFLNYVHEHQNEKIFFISTLQEGYNPYLQYKILSEGVALSSSNYVIRIPALVGTGLCDRFLKEASYPGKIEMTTIRFCAYMILQSALFDDKRMTVIHGDMIEAKTIRELLWYGKNNG